MLKNIVAAMLVTVGMMGSSSAFAGNQSQGTQYLYDAMELAYDAYEHETNSTAKSYEWKAYMSFYYAYVYAYYDEDQSAQSYAEYGITYIKDAIKYSKNSTAKEYAVWALDYGEAGEWDIQVVE
jgi:hypothetical protein